MTSLNYAMTYANDQVRQGKINVDQANVLIVQMMGVRVIEGKIPAQIRKALNAAVKAGELGHIKKDGDVVVLPTMGFSKLEHEGDEYWIGPENQILAKIVK